MKYEYRVIPSPVKGLKAKGMKTQEERFANAIEHTINELAQDDWEYVRAETLPAEERVGLTSKVTKFHNMLVFRRALDQKEERSAPPTPALKAEHTPPPLKAPDASDSGGDDPNSDAPSPEDTPKASSAAEPRTAEPEVTKKPNPGVPNGQMIGILRTIKGDTNPVRVNGEPGSEVAVPN